MLHVRIVAVIMYALENAQKHVKVGVQVVKLIAALFVVIVMVLALAHAIQLAEELV